MLTNNILYQKNVTYYDYLLTSICLHFPEVLGTLRRNLWTLFLGWKPEWLLGKRILAIAAGVHDFLCTFGIFWPRVYQLFRRRCRIKNEDFLSDHYRNRSSAKPMIRNSFKSDQFKFFSLKLYLKIFFLSWPFD